MRKVTELTDRIDIWLERLKPLGLSHWVINVSIVSDDELDANAACTCSRDYDTMWLEFRKGFLKEAEEEDIDRVIIHELVHAAMRNLDGAADGAAEHLALAHRMAWEKTLNHEREWFVEALARTINLAYRSNVVPSSK